IVVDGGLGQLEYARRALQGSGIELVSLAKREELVYTLSDKEPIRLPRNSYALNLLINIRDEAHRFAITYFRQLHTKNGLKSVLSEIEGVGEKRQVELVRHFKNVENISNASVEQIMEVGGINEKTAKNIYDYFNK
ncbi:MAG TPA: helix-hairpin-helix domain-containing protein, partial [Eubacteriales bacterium]|nr:helix-hairpin-helix domain-containing protein [Eubacteriales bacterium]